MTVRESRGRVDEVTWSKLHGGTQIVAEVQAYALRQLEGLTESLERARKVGEVATTADRAQETTGEWLAVLARTVQLQDAMSVLEIDRVLDSSPEEVERHRAGLRNARARRHDKIATATELLLERIGEAVTIANAGVLLHPASAPAAVRASKRVQSSVREFHDLLEITSSPLELEARGWGAAAGDMRDSVLGAAGEGLLAARRGGTAAVGRVADVGGAARGAFEKLPSRLSGFRPRRRRDEADQDEEPAGS